MEPPLPSGPLFQICEVARCLPRLSGTPVAFHLGRAEILRLPTARRLLRHAADDAGGRGAHPLAGAEAALQAGARRAKATTAGEFKALPATAYQMYAPEVFGRSAGAAFTVVGP